MSGKNPRELILDALIKHPEGLNIASLGEISGLHRHSKYLHKLIGAGIDKQRKKGLARLCYLERKIDEKEKKGIVENLEEKWMGKKSQAKLITLVMLIVLISASSLAIASNLLNETYSGFEVFPNFFLENQTVESNFSSENKTNLNETLPEVPILPEPPFLPNKINVELEYPEKITRGENFKVKAKIENLGASSIKILKVEWNLPENFEIVSEKNNCETLKAGSSCFSEIFVSSSLSANLGMNKIKVVVSYE